MGIISTSAHFIATDGEHKATIDKQDTIELQMKNVEQIEKDNGHYILNTGSPHYIYFTKDVNAEDVYQKGRTIRYSEKFGKAGININFVQLNPDKSIHVRTYERGVENETLSCGTGVTASAIAANADSAELQQITVHTPGGTLLVKFKPKGNGVFEDVWLCGPAKPVFEGIIKL